LYAPEILEDYIDSCLVTVFQIHKEAKGDILCFLTGQEEIENLEKLINEQSKSLGSDEDKVGFINCKLLFLNREAIVSQATLLLAKRIFLFFFFLNRCFLITNNIDSSLSHICITSNLSTNKSFRTFSEKY
jgi:HrpA-like RNA helicase